MSGFQSNLVEMRDELLRFSYGCELNDKQRKCISEVFNSTLGLYAPDFSLDKVRLLFPEVITIYK